MKLATSDGQEPLSRVRQLLAQPATLDSYDWLIIATLPSEADESLKKSELSRHSALSDVLDELRDLTRNFTLPAFVQATRPVRRRYPHLFR
jgi:hypothetical protein